MGCRISIVSKGSVESPWYTSGLGCTHTLFIEHRARYIQSNSHLRVLPLEALRPSEIPNRERDCDELRRQSTRASRTKTTVRENEVPRTLMRANEVP